MAAISSIQAELRNLGASSKRHNSELAQSAGRSLAILEATAQSFTDDQATIYALRKYEEFMSPFILACSEASAKSCASALQCVQTLATSRGIAPERLEDLLGALREATQLGLGIQLKILQVLPVLLSEFASDLSGAMVVELIQVCAQLLQSNKVAMVHNAAYATLQQLITGVFDRTDLPPPEAAASERYIVKVDEAVSFEVGANLHDSLMTLLDLCNSAEGLPSTFLKISNLTLTFTLELLELTLSNQAALIHEHTEFATILRIRVVPLLLRLFAENAEFPIVLRIVRIFYLLLRQHLDILTTESEVILSTLAQGARQVAPAGESWKAVMCLEVIQGVILEVQLVQEIYAKFDAQPDRANIIGDLIAQFADTLAASSLTLASDVTQSAYDAVMGEAGVVAGDGVAGEDDGRTGDDGNSGSDGTIGSPSASIGGGAAAGGAAGAPIILSKAFATSVPVIEMLDRLEAPHVHLQHIYYLVVRSANFMSDVVHRLVAGQQDDGRTMLESLASLLLTCHSASLSVATDTELFRFVVRSVQRLAHAAGIVGRDGVRNEFVTLLVQHCVLPADLAASWAVQRCSLCVRALFNLGYALGNQLGPSWNLITTVIVRLGDASGATAATANTVDAAIRASASKAAGGAAGSASVNAAVNAAVQDASGSSLDAFFGDSAALKTINLSMRKLLVGSTQLTEAGMLSFLGALGAGESVLRFRVMEQLARANPVRFGDPQSQCWRTLAQLMLRGVLDPSQAALASAVLGSLALAIMDVEAASGADAMHADASLGMVLRSVCEEVATPNAAVRTEVAQYINFLLDKFGARISGGWECVFEYVDAATASADLAFVQAAFRTVELICHDFIENLPYPQVFRLTLGLDRFARQSDDLNIAFTATSLFWSVCDHLTQMGHDDNTSDGPSGSSKGATNANGSPALAGLDASAITSEADLAAVAQDAASPLKAPALWLFAVMKLASISGAVAHQQVRTSATQIFLRLYNTHGEYLSAGAWQISLVLVFPALMASNLAVASAEPAEVQESRLLVVDGYSNIIDHFFARVAALPTFAAFWAAWTQFLDASVGVSAKAARAVYASLIRVLAKDTAGHVSRPTLAAFWGRQSLRPAFAGSRPRETADALVELVRLFAALRDAIPTDQALTSLAACALFPNYTSPAADTAASGAASPDHGMSVLQRAATRQLATLHGATAHKLGVLSEMAVAPLEPAPEGTRPWFGGVARWAQDALLGILRDAAAPLSPELAAAAPPVVAAMNRILASREPGGVATQVVLRLYELAGAASGAETFQLILERTDRANTAVDAAATTEEGAGGSAHGDEIAALDALLRILATKDLDAASWRAIAHALLAYSVLYERGVHTAAAYTAAYAGDAGDAAAALRFGSVEPPTRVRGTAVAFFCLRTLRELGAAGRPYSADALQAFHHRVEGVLNQYIGLCKVLGREPLRELVHAELVFVLEQLAAQHAVVSVVIRTLVLQSLSRAHREFLPYMEEILAGGDHTH